MAKIPGGTKVSWIDRIPLGYILAAHAGIFFLIVAIIVSQSLGGGRR